MKIVLLAAATLAVASACGSTSAPAATLNASPGPSIVRHVESSVSGNCYLSEPLWSLYTDRQLPAVGATYTVAQLAASTTAFTTFTVRETATAIDDDDMAIAVNQLMKDVRADSAFTDSEETGIVIMSTKTAHDYASLAHLCVN